MVLVSIDSLKTDKAATNVKVEVVLKMIASRRHTKPERRYEANLTPGTSSSKEAVDVLMEMMHDNTISPSEVPSGPKSPAARVVSGGSPRRDELLSEDIYPTILSKARYKEYRKMVADVGILKGSAESTTIKFGNLGLRNLQECGQWIAKNFEDAIVSLSIRCCY